MQVAFFSWGGVSMSHVRVESGEGMMQLVTAGAHQFRADEPKEAGGNGAAPTPYEYLLAALGGCTSMTLLMYARRKGIPLEKVAVELDDARVYAKDCEDCMSKDGFIHQIQRVIHLEGPLTGEQRAHLLEIADKCPVHKTLTAEIKIRTTLM